MLTVSKGTLWAGIISGGLAQLKVQSAYSNGALAGNEYAVHTTKNISGALGLMAGLEFGAMFGSRLMPGIGTVVGTVIGGILGDRLGTSIGMQVGSTLFNHSQQTPNFPLSQPVKQIQ